VSSYYCGDRGACTKQHAEEQDVGRRVSVGEHHEWTSASDLSNGTWSLMTENTRRNMIRKAELR
jgi:hypothetical protein